MKKEEDGGLSRKGTREREQRGKPMKERNAYEKHDEEIELLTCAWDLSRWNVRERREEEEKTQMKARMLIKREKSAAGNLGKENDRQWE